VQSDSWWLDAVLDDRHVVVEWHETKGFGVSTPEADAYGIGADEVYGDIDDVCERVSSLLQRGGRTLPPRELTLQRLRAELRLTQEHLASLLHVQQASVSKLERRADRSDIRLSTLRRLVKVMGGELEVRARFSDRVVSLASLDEDPVDKGEYSKRRREEVGHGHGLSPMASPRGGTR